MHRRTFVHAALTAGLATLQRPAWAQQKYPNRPIKFIVPFAAGGGGDVVARLLAKALSDRINNPVIVDNRTGAGGNIGADFVLKSPPDGYTLLNMSSTYPIQAAVSRLPFDPVADMQPIMMVSRDPALVLVNGASPLKSARELLASAGASPGKLTYGSSGPGSIAHLGMEELAYVMGVRLVHVPYKGSSQAFNDLLGGSIDMMLSSTTFSLQYIKDGKVRALGIAGSQRAATLPEVPTFAEQGFEYQLFDWKAIAGPRGMPPDVVAYLNRELNGVLKHKAVVSRFETDGASAVGGTPDQMMQVVRSDIERWKDLVKKAKVKVE